MSTFRARPDAEGHRKPRPALNDRLVNFFETVADNAPVRSRRSAFVTTLVVVALLLLTTLVVYLTNGTGQPMLHLAYLPTIIASLALGLVSGVVTALVAGLVVLGPLMPLDIAAGELQNLASVLYRSAFLVLVALMSGSFGESIRRQRQRAELNHDKLQRLYARNLKLFASLVSERDKETADHCERVAHNCVLLGREFGMSDLELSRLFWSGMLHDLGKLGVPEAILQKPTALTGEEYEIVKRHAKLGADFLTSLSKAFEPVAAGVRWHHERWDGTGYPDGLEGKEIPLSARILAVADVFEAVTSDRPYHHALSANEALEIIKAGGGTHFDPIVAERFVSLAEQGRLLTQNMDFSTAGDEYVMDLVRF